MKIVNKIFFSRNKIFFILSVIFILECFLFGSRITTKALLELTMIRYSI